MLPVESPKWFAELSEREGAASALPIGVRKTLITLTQDIAAESAMSRYLELETDAQAKRAAEERC